MSTRNQTNNPPSKKNNRRTPEGKQFAEARVVDCIRDSDHPYYTGPDSLGTIFYDKVRFRKRVRPGDTIDLFSKVVSEKRGIWKFDCRAELDNEIVCTATILCADRKA